VNFRTETVRAGAVALALVGASAVGLALSPSASATTPPWQGSNPDPNNVGTLAFYDASGTQIYTGLTTDQPFAAFVQGSTTARAGDTRAALFAYTPTPSQPPGDWVGTPLTGAATFPDAAAPGALGTSTLPVYSGTAGDTPLDSQVSTYPNASTAAGYQNVYELRLRTSVPGQPYAPGYDVADVVVSGTTWTQVFPAPSTPPSAPTAVTATPGNGAATVSWTAPSGAPAGYDVRYSSTGGSTWSAPVSFTSAATTEKVSGLTNGTAYLFQVRGVNAAGSGAWSASSAAVTPVGDSTSISLTAPTSVKYKTSATLNGTVKDTTTGKVLGAAALKLYRKAPTSSTWTYVKTVTSSSTGAYRTTYLLTANQQFQFRYLATTAHNAASSATKSVSALQVITVHTSASTVAHGHSVKIYGTVSPSGSGEHVSLQRYVGGAWKTLSTVTLKSQKLPSGTSTVGFVFGQTPATAGTYKYRVTKASTSTLAAGTSVTLTIKAT